MTPTPTSAPTDPARSPGPAAPDGAGTGALRSLLPVLGAHRATVLRTCLAALVDQAALVALVTLAAYTVGTAVTEHRPPAAGTLAVLIGLVLLRALATWREMDLSHDLAYRVLAELRVRVFDGLARSAPARIAGRLQRRPRGHRARGRRGTGVLLRPRHRPTPRIRRGLRGVGGCAGGPRPLAAARRRARRAPPGLVAAVRSARACRTRGADP